MTKEDQAFKANIERTLLMEELERTPSLMNLKKKIKEWCCALDHLGHHYRPTQEQIENGCSFEPRCLFCGKKRLTKYKK